MIIAVDGPAASGKGTLAKGLARHYGLPYLDTGLLYRAAGRAVADRLDAADLEHRALLAAQSIEPATLDRAALGTAEVALAAARVARFESVRAALRGFQRDFAARPGGAVIDGRDIGTRICPGADVKLFVTASAGVRAERRTAQLQGQGGAAELKQILKQIEARDKSDRENPAGAFFLAQDAHLLDTTELDIEAALRAAIAIADRVMARKAGDPS